jgi:hypothetical protein
MMWTKIEKNMHYKFDYIKMKCLLKKKNVHNLK